MIIVIDNDGKQLNDDDSVVMMMMMMMIVVVPCTIKIHIINYRSGTISYNNIDVIIQIVSSTIVAVMMMMMMMILMVILIMMIPNETRSSISTIKNGCFTKRF
jgi:hypothetical protein